MLGIMFAAEEVEREEKRTIDLLRANRADPIGRALQVPDAASEFTRRRAAVLVVARSIDRSLGKVERWPCERREILG